MKTTAYSLILALLIAMAMAGGAWAAAAPGAEVGSIVNLKGGAVIERGGQKLDAKVNDKLQLQDTVSTRAESRAKLLFLDESILTLAPNSRVNMKEFVYSREGGGTTIFNLIEGKMRAVVGKNKFEVHTSTTVAAARGTIIQFEVGVKDGKPFTRIICLEGTVEVRSSDPSIPGSIFLHAGEEVLIFEGEPLPTPGPAGEGGGEGEPPVFQAPPSVSPGTPVPVKIKINIP
jgi:ferric-dicitrate binding protein FerR (iron transport regulator)